MSGRPAWASPDRLAAATAAGVNQAGASATGANQAGAIAIGANEQELGALADSLDLSPQGTAVWLRQLERNGAATERLLAVTTSESW